MQKETPRSIAIVPAEGVTVVVEGGGVAGRAVEVELVALMVALL